jgi:hypothetical protein
LSAPNAKRLLYAAAWVLGPALNAKFDKPASTDTESRCSGGADETLMCLLAALGFCVLPLTAQGSGPPPSRLPILLHYDTTEGHSERRPVGKQIEDDTDELSFLFWQLSGKP